MIPTRLMPLGACPHLTAKNYVQDGLVAMWDGIENAGWGVHDHSTLVLKELCGTANDLVINPAHGTLGDSYLHCDGAAVAARGSAELPSFSKQQIEAVYRITGRPYNGNNFLIDLYKGSTYVSGDFRKFSIYARYTSAVGLSSNCGIQRNPISNTIYAVSAACDAALGDNVFVDKAWENGVAKTLMNPGGAANNSVYPTMGSSAAGDVYCVRVYSRALTAEEIAHNYAIDKERFNLP